jgi:hypothetical protein
MSVVCEEIYELTEFAEDLGIPLNGCAAAAEAEPLPARMAKVLAIRHQLAEGTYHLDEKLDAVLDALLEVLYV